MEPKDIQLWMSIINTLVIWAAAIYTFLANRNRVTNERITSLQGSLTRNIDSLRADVDRRLDTHAERLTRVESDLKHAPTDEDIKRLHARIDDMAGSLGELSGEFKGANHTLQLIHAYMLQWGKQ
jgi:hypothetical protein